MLDERGDSAVLAELLGIPPQRRRRDGGNAAFKDAGERRGREPLSQVRHRAGLWEAEGTGCSRGNDHWGVRKARAGAPPHMTGHSLYGRVRTRPNTNTQLANASVQ